ncbi:MAG TPA: XrtA/PEP-CTERM system TPR-repeat protein PrsT [Rhodanobacteraceae bacterium]
MHMTGFHNQRVNRILAVLGTALLLAGCGIARGHGSVAAGDKFQAEGKYRAAYIEAKKVLQHDAKDSAAWVLLGKASLMLGNPNDAQNELDHAKQNGAPASAWAVPMGKTLLVMGKYQDVLQTVAPSVALDAADKVPAEVLRGDAYRGLGKAAEAKAAYTTALQQDPGDVRALVGMAALAMATSDVAAAQGYVKKALAAAPDNPQAWVGKADLAFAGKDYAGAEADFQKALGLKSIGWLPQDRFEAQSRLADAQMRQGQLDKALANITELEKMAPGQPYPHYLHAVALYRQGHLADAVDQLQQVLKTRPDNVPAQMLMGAVNYAQGNYGQAGMYLGNVLGADPGQTAARKMLALTYFREGRSGQALNALRPTAPAGATDAELLAVLQRAVAAGEGMPQSAAPSGGQPVAPIASGAASAAPVAMAALDPRLAPADAALAKGDADKAIRLLQKITVTGEPATAQRTTLLAMAEVRAGKPDAAMKTASAYVAAHPKDSAAHLLYATALVAANKRDDARAQYQQAIKLDPKNLAALMSLGSLDMLEAKYAEAATQYQAILHQDPHNAAAMNALGQMSALQKDQAGAIKWYRQAIAAQPKEPSAYLGLVMVYSRAGQFDQAATVARQLAGALPDNPAALNAYGAAELNAGDVAAALPPLEKAVKLAPKEALFRTNLARAQVLAKDPKAAEANLAAVVKADPAQAQATVLLAFMKLQAHDLPGALALARGLQQQPATKAAGLALEGDLYMADKAFAKAAQSYQQGLQVAYDRPLVVKTFLALNAAKAKQPEAVLQAWLVKHADDAATRMLLAQYYMNHGQDDAAVDQYTQVLKAHPANIDALNNLAWLYTGKQNQQALALAEHAYKLAPTSPGIMDTYAWALLANDKAKPALPLLQKAAQAAPGNAAIQYHLAVAQSRSGDKAGALATLAALQKSNVPFADAPAAAKLYASLRGEAGAGK